jgi:F-type H+-transporting ATPase subunit gamma
LCGGLNVNVQRVFINKVAELRDRGVSVEVVALGNKGLGFLNRINAKVVADAVGLGDEPHLESLIGPLKVLFDDYVQGRISAIYLCYTRFVNTMKQEPVVEKLLPLSADHLQVRGGVDWDYIYEPDAPSVIDDLILRYVESLIYQSVAENLASEHSARMVAMQAATDNAVNIVNDLKLVYNKTRQAAITTELTEIVAGAAAV